MSTHRLNRYELRREAVGVLRKLGYTSGYIEYTPPRRRYHYVASKEGNTTRFRPICRNADTRHRYGVGVYPELIGVVDYFVFYFHGKSYIYLVPSAFLKDIYDGLDSPSIKENGQWFCNINYQCDLFETRGLREHADISAFLVRVHEDGAQAA